jgi:hypothetical protein
MHDPDTEQRFDPPRDLTDAERAALTALLVDDVPDVATLRLQAASARVSGVCRCGCPSVTFAVDRALPRAQVGHRVPVDGYANDDAGHEVMLLLHVLAGYLHELEIYRADGGALPEPPLPTSVVVASWDW